MRVHQGEIEDRDEQGCSITPPAHPCPPPPTWTPNIAALLLSLLLIIIVLLSENTSGFQDEVQGLSKTQEALYELFPLLPWPYRGAPDTLWVCVLWCLLHPQCADFSAYPHALFSAHITFTVAWFAWLTPDCSLRFSSGITSGNDFLSLLQV